MNERDSELVAHDLMQNGYDLVNNESDADVVLLNTCSVREKAEKKAIGKANNLLSKSKKKKQITLGILGCMAQNLGTNLVDEVKGVNLIVGTQKFHRISQYLKKISTGHLANYQSRVIDLEEEEGSHHTINQHLSSSAEQVSAFVSIMQGCNMNCSFCIVPKTRGNERYREMSEICDEIKILRDRGIKEVTLLGQIVNAYGRGVFPRLRGESPFVQLVNKIHGIEGIERIRFTSPHPTSFGPDLIEAFAALPKLGDYTHLPLQSGSNKMLKSMNRPYKREKFLELVTALRNINQNMRISTDIIVGYPGETEAEFEETVSAFKEAAFEMAFIFKYSERTGTPAAQFPDKIPKKIKEERNQIMLKILERQSEASNLKKVDKIMEVLVESKARKGRGELMGRTRCYRKVIFEAGGELIGQIVPVRIKVASSTLLKGSVA